MVQFPGVSKQTLKFISGFVMLGGQFRLIIDPVAVSNHLLAGGPPRQTLIDYLETNPHIA